MAECKIFGHRGASSICPENTMAAFEMCASVKADGIELDVQFTRDGKLIVLHDETLERTTGVKGLVKDYAYEEIRLMEAGAWFSEDFRGQRIPLLEEILLLCKHTNMLINIELKTDRFNYQGIEASVLELLKKLDMTESAVISSFNHYTIMRVKALMPDIKCGLLYSGHLYNPHLYARYLNVEALHPAMHTVTSEIIKDAKREGLEINSWFMQEKFDEIEARSLLSSGVNTIITNYPQLYININRKVDE